jgi:hypothetical protein
MKKALWFIGAVIVLGSIGQYLMVSAAANPPALGGTGTSQLPTSGQVLLGNASQTYTPTTLYSLFGATSPLTYNASTGVVSWTNSNGYATTTIASVLKAFSATGLASYNSSTGVISVSSSSLVLGSASHSNTTDFLASSTPFVSSFNTRTGAVTLSSGDVATALGYTPYSAANPNNFATTTIQSVLNALSAQGLATYNSSTGVFSVSSSSLLLGTASQHPTSDFLPSSTLYISSFNTRTGAITLASSDVTTALSFTPYNASNPAGYVGGQGNGVAGDCVKWGTSSTITDALAPCGSGTSSSTVGPFSITGPNGTSTIYGGASSSYIYNINGNPQMPSPTMLAAGALCGTSYPDYDFGKCFMDWQSYLGAAATYDLGPYTYAHSYPIIYKYYNLLKGHGQSLLSFTPSYYAITSANSSTKAISYSTVASGTYFNGEAVTAVGASLPTGIVIGKLYYVGSLTSSTLVLYTNSALTTTSTVTGTGTGTLETPELAGDGGQNPSYGWGSDGVSFVGPNNGSSTGIFIGGPNGARSFTLANGSVTHFYYNIEGGDNSYFVTIQNFYSYRNAPNTNATTYGGLLWMDATANSGEEWNLNQSVFADAQPANNTNAVNYAVTWMTSGFVDVECNGTSLDDAGFYFNVYDGEGNSYHENNCHHENPGSAGGGWGAIIPFSTNSGNPNVSVDVDWSNVTVLNNANGGNAMPEVMVLGPGVMFNGTGVSVQNNSYVGASQIPVFATVASGDYFTMTGFHNIGDTPGVQYMYGTRAPTAGYISNAPSFIDSTLQVTGNLTYYNGFIGNPVVDTVSSTLQGYSPNYQVCTGTSTINYTLPTVANNTGLDFDFVNTGSANCTATATSTDLIYANSVTSTALTFTAGQAIRLIDTGVYWTLLSTNNQGIASYNVTSANPFISVSTTTTSAALTFSSSSLNLGTASTYPATNFLASSTTYVSLFNGSSGVVTYAPSSTIYGAGTYLGTSGSSLTVSSTLASSTWSLTIQNATSTASTTNYASVRSSQSRTITSLFCYDSVATTTLNIFIPKSFATTTVSSTINASFSCGISGNSTTLSTSIAPGSYVDVEVSSTVGTPVGTFLYIDTTKL